MTASALIMHSPADSFARGLGRWGARLLRFLPAETAHEVGLWLLENGLVKYLPRPSIQALASGFSIDVPGLGLLPHPLGLAGGFDKNAVAPLAFASLGAAFIEMGTVTPRSQGGNKRPRVFRDVATQTLINRMGFPSQGIKAVAARIEALNWGDHNAPLGINLGKNADTPEELALDDYIIGLKSFRDLVSFYVLNVSSPNTPGLRRLANADFLGEIAARETSLLPRMWVKLSPDLSKRELQSLVERITNLGYRGLILTNTHRVDWPHTGGQSGQALSVLATTALEWAYEVHKGALVMIASGGVMSGADVFQKLARGASAVQIYSALVYRGPWAFVELLEELSAELSLRGYATVRDAIGSHYGP